jgi:hypothetical protein
MSCSSRAILARSLIVATWALDKHLLAGCGLPALALAQPGFAASTAQQVGAEDDRRGRQCRHAEGHDLLVRPRDAQPDQRPEQGTEQSGDEGDAAVRSRRPPGQAVDQHRYDDDGGHRLGTDRQHPYSAEQAESEAQCRQTPTKHQRTAQQCRHGGDHRFVRHRCHGQQGDRAGENEVEHPPAVTHLEASHVAPQPRRPVVLSHQTTVGFRTDPSAQPPTRHRRLP